MNSTTSATPVSSSRAGAGRTSLSTAARVPRRTSSQKSWPTSAEHDQLRGITLNIGAAAAPRATAILEWLGHRDDHVVVLTETSCGAGTTILATGLNQRGYQIVATPPSNDRGVLIATKIPVRRRICHKLEVTLPWRAAGVLLNSSPQLVVVGVYVPSRDRSPAKIARKEKFIGSFVNALAGLPAGLREHLLVAGDYNVVSRRHVPARRGYFSYEYAMHDALEDLGLAAAHELQDNEVHPYSWIGHTGDGYLYDYIHIGGALQSRIDGCEYLHTTRENRLSDHAAVAFTCRVDTRPVPTSAA